MASPDIGIAEEVWLRILNTSTAGRSLTITNAFEPSCETINWVGTKLPWPRLKDVAAPLVAVGAQPSGARDTRKRSSPGESTVRTVVVVVAVLKVRGATRLVVSRPSAWRNEGSAGR